MNIAIISLGCPKNQVDADVLCRQLLEAGHRTVPEMAMADLVVVNTCGFIQPAKEEAIEHILDACMLKREKPTLKVVVTGCLAERYHEEIAAEIPEVDAVVGIGKNTELANIIQIICGNDKNGEVESAYSDISAVPPLVCMGAKTDLPLGGPRVISTPAHYAWLKIAEGCSNACSYCAIPIIRGPMRSRPLEDCVAEARWLAEQGVRELVLVAQDVTAYGRDCGENRLGVLLDALNTVEGIRWIRLLYCYPERIDDALLDAIVRNDKVLHYFDLPIQHISDRILTSMRRRGGSDAVRNALQLIRKRMPGATLRTSLIVGYPGETEEEFKELCNFVRDVRFDRLGCFAYSPEEATPAAELPGLPPEEERWRRADEIMEMQSRILMDKQEQMAGKTIYVLCDGWDDSLQMWRCHGVHDAPEIDLNVFLSGGDELLPGQFYLVRVVGLFGVDLMAEIVIDAL